MTKNINKHIYLFLLTILITAFSACGKQEPSQKSEQPPPAPNSTDYLGAMGRSLQTAERITDLSSVKQAINLFYASENRYPASLQELTSSGYLPVLPELPTGYSYIYNPQSGEISAAKSSAQPIRNNQ